MIQRSPEINRIEKLQINRRKGFSFLCFFYVSKRRDPFTNDWAHFFPIIFLHLVKGYTVT